VTSVPAPYEGYVQTAASATGLPESVVAAQINLESGFDPRAVSPAGAEGIAQFLPSTFAQYGSGSPFNPADAFAAYDKYMSALLKSTGGNVARALSEYNSGSPTAAIGSYADPILQAAGQPLTITSGTPAADTSSGGGSGFEWWNPATWADPAIGAAEQGARSITGTVLRWATTGVVVVAGLGLVVWGVARGTGAGRKAETVIETAGPAAAAAAAA
jgi:hypothetical protein